MKNANSNRFVTLALVVAAGAVVLTACGQEVKDSLNATLNPTTKAGTPAAVTAPASAPVLPGVSVVAADGSVTKAQEAPPVPVQMVGSTPVVVLSPEQMGSYQPTPAPGVVVGPPPAPGMAPQYQQAPVVISDYMVDYWQRQGLSSGIGTGGVQRVPTGLTAVKVVELSGRLETDSADVIRISNNSGAAVKVRASGTYAGGSFNPALGGEAGVTLNAGRTVDVRRATADGYTNNVQVHSSTGWAGFGAF